MNLAHFEYAGDNVKVALKIIRHVIKYLHILFDESESTEFAQIDVNDFFFCSFFSPPRLVDLYPANSFSFPFFFSSAFLTIANIINKI